MRLPIDSATLSYPARQQRLRAVAAGADWLVRQPLAILGLALAAATLVFVMATPRVLPVLGGLATTVLIGAGGPWLSLIGLRGRITFAAERCRVGEPVDMRVTTTWYGRPTTQQPRVSWPGMTLASGAGTLTPHRRGRLPAKNARPVLESDWPFGIMTARKRLDVTRSLVVRPVTRHVRFPTGLLTIRRSGRGKGTGLAGTTGDVIGLREYRMGDHVRSIHWRQTARQGEVVVCERPGTATPSVQIIVHDDGTKQPISQTRLDAAVSLASSLVESWSIQGAHVEVRWTLANEVAFSCRPRDQRTLDDTLDTLACIEVEPATAKPALDGASTASPFSSARHSDRKASDLKVLIDVGVAPETSVTMSHKSANSVLVTLETATALETFRVPESSEAAAALDQALAEIGHEPDATRHG